MPIDARYRDILVTIDSQYFDSAPIKNDLQWKSPTNRVIFKTLGQNDGFRKMLQKIKDYNIKNVKDYSMAIPPEAFLTGSLSLDSFVNLPK